MTPRQRWVVLGIALGLGAALRVRELAALASLDVDEAMLTLSIATRGYGGLLHPLDYGQTGPILFLWAERLAASLGGVNELALRAVPFLAGLALPWLVWRFGRRLLAPEAALLATGLAALSPLLVRYSAIVKPYALDAVCCAVLGGLALDTLQQPESARPWRVLLAAGAVAVLASQPAVFVLAGVIAALAAEPRVRQAPAATRRLVTAGMLWGGLAGATYIAVYRPAATDSYMQDFWAASFLSGGAPPLFERLPLMARGVLSPLVFGARLHLVVVVLFLCLLVAGLVALKRRLGLPVALLVAGPLVASLGASVFHRYPIAARVLLFAAPLLIVMMADGAATAIAWLRHPVARGAGWVLVAGWLVAIAGRAAKPRGTPDVRPMVAEWKASAAPGAPVYVLATAVPMWAVYTTDWAEPDTARLWRFARVAGPGGPAFHNAPPRNQPVTTEGRDLVWGEGGGSELLGVSTGMQIRDLTGLTRRDPDPGWVENEVGRMLALPAEDVWLLLAFTWGTEGNQLLAGLDAAGGTRVFERRGRDAALYRYRLPTR